MFIAALFTIARTRKQPRCPWTDEWIKKWWYIYTMEYYSAIKWNTFEIIIFSEISQRRQIPYDNTHLWSLKYDPNELIYETEIQTWKANLWLPKRKGVGEG